MFSRCTNMGGFLTSINVNLLVRLFYSGQVAFSKLPTRELALAHEVLQDVYSGIFDGNAIT